jgi:hypothetical protein
LHLSSLRLARAPNGLLRKQVEDIQSVSGTMHGRQILAQRAIMVSIWMRAFKTASYIFFLRAEAS